MDGWLKRISVLNANLPIWINGRVIHPLQFCCENFTYIDLNRLRDSEGYKFVSCDTVMCYPLYNTSWYLCLKYNGLACVNLIKYRLRGGQAFNKFTNKNLVCSQCFTSRSRRRACSQAKKKFLYYVFLPTIFFVITSSLHLQANQLYSRMWTVVYWNFVVIVRNTGKGIL